MAVALTRSMHQNFIDAIVPADLCVKNDKTVLNSIDHGVFYLIPYFSNPSLP